MVNQIHVLRGEGLRKALSDKMFPATVKLAGTDENPLEGVSRATLEAMADFGDVYGRFTDDGRLVEFRLLVDPAELTYVNVQFSPVAQGSRSVRKVRCAGGVYYEFTGEPRWQAKRAR